MKKTCFSIVALAMLALISGCVSQARISDFQKTSNGIDFDALAKRDYDGKGAVWTEKGGYEYYIEVQKVSESDLVDGISQALKRLHYVIRSSNSGDNAIIARRGLEANEWASVAGVYYRLNGDRYQIYIRNKITQDFTGGWRENRAREIADAICGKLGGCVDLHAGK